MANHAPTPASGASPRHLPIKVPLPQAPGLFGISRSSIYRAAKAGHVKLSKLGTATLVDTASILAYLDSLPTIPPEDAV